MSEVARAHSRVANAAKAAKRRGDPPGSPEVTEARRRLAEAKIEKYVLATLASAPPLSSEVRSRLALLLQAGVAGS